ncbi:hypothetical protein RXV86_08665 [Alisedimentitalea sp. MJ-SS2]|uniref:hypothetical protein n=1 Tax=Aliisedimentitalea sp. MJ-SS2 TaxID=3049795 RepID=UPI00291341CC|nr:hypothetical protein [Alisedimentitalea sp. MJ-SS2]MDU8927453.1 hypothetical protein [Alisedimentitalea sp. MJ-SS2]
MTATRRNSSKNFAKSFRKLLVTLALTLAPLPALAQEVEPCEWQASAWNLAEPWEQNTRTFANGNVRLALLDTVEPAAGAFHVLVLSPPYDEVGGRQCRTVSMGGGIGFSGADFSTLDASYDPSVGLIFTMQVRRFDPDSGDFLPATLRFTLNQATGHIGVRLQ